MKYKDFYKDLIFVSKDNSKTKLVLKHVPSEMEIDFPEVVIRSEEDFNRAVKLTKIYRDLLYQKVLNKSSELKKDQSL